MTMRSIPQMLIRKMLFALMRPWNTSGGMHLIIISQLCVKELLISFTCISRTFLEECRAKWLLGASDDDEQRDLKSPSPQAN